MDSRPQSNSGDAIVINANKDSTSSFEVFNFY